MAFWQGYGYNDIMGQSEPKHRKAKKNKVVSKAKRIVLVRPEKPQKVLRVKRSNLKASVRG